MTHYQTTIHQTLAAIGRDHDPRHVEGWMRSEHGTLDALSPQRFRREVEIACRLIDHAGTEASERLARSYGI